MIHIKTITDKTEKMLNLEKIHKEEIEETLRRKYVDENKPTKSIAKELSISYVTAFKWLLLAGIYSRKLDI